MFSGGHFTQHFIEASEILILILQMKELRKVTMALPKGTQLGTDKKLELKTVHLNVHVLLLTIVVIQSFSHVQLFVTPWTAPCQASLCLTISQSSLKLTSIELVMPSNHLVLVIPFFSCLQPFPALGSHYTIPNTAMISQMS